MSSLGNSEPYIPTSCAQMMPAGWLARKRNLEGWLLTVRCSWQAYIDFEISEGERSRTRALYERLLDSTKHVKVWLSYASFEAAPLPTFEEDGEEAASESGPESAAEREVRARRYTCHHNSPQLLQRILGPAMIDVGHFLLEMAGPSFPRTFVCARRGPEESAECDACWLCSVYERAFRSLRETQPDAKEEAVMLLEAWRSFERGASVASQQQRAGAVEAVEKRMPKRIKRKRAIVTDEGMDAGMEVRACFQLCNCCRELNLIGFFPSCDLRCAYPCDSKLHLWALLMATRGNVHC